MIEIKGKHNKAKVFTHSIEPKAIEQITELCNQEIYKDSKIRIMPDTHAGAGCTIGTTMTITDKICPNLVGVDIGCGMYCVKLNEKDIDFKLLDETIRKYIPSGQNIRNTTHSKIKETNIDRLKCLKYINYDRAVKSIGTLGGGNHFIEIDKDNNNNLYLVIHSGSRYLGKQVAEYYQELGYKKLTDNKIVKEHLIKKLKHEGRQKDIQKELQKIPNIKINKQLAYVENEDLNNYLHDMKITQEYAKINRMVIAEEILKHMELTINSSFTTIHNYIDIENKILRKGAISAQKDEKVIIPINMRDGSIIAIGKSNEDWNCSAPHGAGRLISRTKAKELITLQEFQKEMNDIWTTSVNNNTIDECPMVYKPMDEIVNNIKDTVDIVDIIKPIYNFKASE